MLAQTSPCRALVTQLAGSLLSTDPCNLSQFEIFCGGNLLWVRLQTPKHVRFLKRCGFLLVTNVEFNSVRRNFLTISWMRTISFTIVFVDFEGFDQL